MNRLSSAGALLLLVSSLILFSDPPSAEAQSATLDGNLAEWSAFDRVDLLPYQGASGDEFYSRSDGVTYFLGIRSPALRPGAQFTIWMNTDANASTGYQVFGFAGGAEFNITGTVGGAAALYSGAAAQTLVSTAVQSAAGSSTIEIAIPRTVLASGSDFFEALVDLGGERFLPQDFSLFRYRVPGTPRPLRTSAAKRVAIIYSDTTAKRFFDRKAYALLFAAAQNQALMAGIPFDLLEETDVTQISKLVRYDAIVFPLFSHVPAAMVANVQHNLRELSYRYRIGLVASGDLVTNDENGGVLPGDAYRTMKDVLGIVPTATEGPAPLTLVAADVSHPVVRGYAPNEVVREYSDVFFRTFSGLGAVQTTTLVSQQTRGSSFNAILATTTGSKNVHFSTERFLGDTNVLWSALRWIVLGSDARAVLRTTRQSGLSLLRFDGLPAGADRAAVVARLRELAGAGVKGAVYLRTTETFREEAAALRASGYELGLLPATSLTTPPGEFEALVGAEKAALEAIVGESITGAALSSFNTPLDQTLRLGVAFTSVSGEPSILGEGYPGAFGVLGPRSPLVYAAPNFVPGRDTLPALLRRAPAPIIHRTVAGSELLLGAEAFEAELASYRAFGLEAVTMTELMGRLRGYRAASLVETLESDGSIDVDVRGNGLGTGALDCERAIGSVDGWYAYSGSRVFLPEQGGSFTVRFGATPDVVRLSSLPEGARLFSATGDGKSLDVVLSGSGLVRVAVPQVPGVAYDMVGASEVRREGAELVGRIDFADPDQLVIAGSVCGDGAVFPGEACDDGNNTQGDGCSATCGIEQDFSCGGEPSVCAVAFTRLRLPAVQGESGWVSSAASVRVTKRQLKELRVGASSAETFRGVVSFDTSTIDGRIVSASLVLPLSRPLPAKAAKALGGLAIQLKRGAFGKSLGLEAADYRAKPSVAAAGTVKPLPVGAMTIEIPLTSQAAAMLDRDGKTQVRLSATAKRGSLGVFRIPLAGSPRLEVSVR